MKTSIEAVSEPEIGADEWIRGADAVNVHVANNRVSGLDLERMKSEFLANGGKVQKIPRGASGQVHSQLNNVIVQITSNFTADEIDIHVAPKVNRQRKADHDMVDKVRELLPVCELRKDLYTALCCSDDKVQRILRMYFKDDENAQKFMRQSMDDTEFRVVREYPKVARSMSNTNAARALSVNYSTLMRYIKAHGLKPAAEE